MLLIGSISNLRSSLLLSNFLFILTPLPAFHFMEVWLLYGHVHPFSISPYICLAPCYYSQISTFPVPLFFALE